MSEFACEVVRVRIIPHPNADAIEIALVGDYQSIVKKGQFQDGQLAVYIPEQALLTEWLLQYMGFWDALNGKGTLHGSGGNRVKAIKLRGVVSQGLVVETDCVPFRDADGELLPMLEEGQDVAELLGVTKWAPALPAYMRGKMISKSEGEHRAVTHKYDFENVKKDPKLFREGDEVVISEKIHGTFIEIIVVPEIQSDERFYKGRVVVSSKGLGGRGIILDHNDETNIYIQAAKKHGLLDQIIEVLGFDADVKGVPCGIYGEVFGLTPTGGHVQAGFPYTHEVLDFRLFDVSIGVRESALYLDFGALEYVAGWLNVKLAPVLYKGPFSKQKMLELTDGPTTLIPPRGKVAHIREGVVVKALSGEQHVGSGTQRKIAKSISDAYLLRKGEATEFQ